MRIGKIFTFDAAHYLPKYKGDCHNLHGHTYKLEVEVYGPIVKNNKSTIEGMVMDFKDLKEMVEEVVLSSLDHTYLNDKFDNPTAELIALKIFAQLDMYFEEEQDRGISKIRLWETSTSYVEVHYEDLQHFLQH
jgi:6-pyruvoyltetrahydropterin/6-carboxytetrahydropterin synthase